MMTADSGAHAVPWDDFIERARHYRLGNPRHDEEEIILKVDAGRQYGRARDLALQALWATITGPPLAERIRTFCQEFPTSVISGAGTRAHVVSVLLMGENPENYPPYKKSYVAAACEQTGYPLPKKDADEAELYQHALGFLDWFIEEAAARNLRVRHRLDAQSIIWRTLTSGGQNREKVMRSAHRRPHPHPRWTISLGNCTSRSISCRTSKRCSGRRSKSSSRGLALAFGTAARGAFSRGLLHGYCTEEDARPAALGRIRFGDQIRSRFGIALPVEVRNDEFTADIPANRLLKAAAHRLARLRLRSREARSGVAWVAESLGDVSLAVYPPRTVPEIRFDRLNEHYRGVVTLARLVPRHGAFETCPAPWRRRWRGSETWRSA